MGFFQSVGKCLTLYQILSLNLCPELDDAEAPLTGRFFLATVQRGENISKGTSLLRQGGGSYVTDKRADTVPKPPHDTDSWTVVATISDHLAAAINPTAGLNSLVKCGKALWSVYA